MGYSISARFKNEKSRDDMLLFLNQNQRLLDKLKKSEPHLFSIEATLGEDLGYAPRAPKNTYLGFHGTLTPHCLWAISAWMGVKSDYRDKSGNAVFYYDNQKTLITQGLQNTKNFQVDEKGIFIERKKTGLEKVVSVLMQPHGYEKTREVLEELEEKYSNYMALKNSVPSKKNKM